MVETKTLYANTDEPIVIQFTEDKEKDIHKYEVLSPEKYAGKKQGVTSTTSFKDKSGVLMQWAANMALEAKSNGQPDTVAKYAHIRKRDKAGDIGTRVHTWIEDFLKGDEHSYTPDMRESVEGFLRWYKSNDVVTHWSERIVYSKELDYAGKLDWGGTLDGRYGLIDWKTGNCDEQYSSYHKRKTGKMRAKAEHLVQNAGYDIPIIEEDQRPAEFYGVLYIPITGKVEYFETTETDKARDAYKHTLNAKRGWKALESTNKYREPTG